MKKQLSRQLEEGRFRDGPMGSRTGDMHGAFRIRGPKGLELAIISSGVDFEYGWEHVSISTKSRTPNWQEMCYVKDLFWDEEECVVQYHPRKSDYVNHHPFCLHLWRPLDGQFPTPPAVLVGPKK